ncbi:polysialyltransferase family glycosyltransferase [Pontibacter sp. H259]|uniref:polysialyltransferase family glycosyltransferase n=1 Tax=Pontibacter sp. H259 TaxID=3133421 RepID=UPI0030BA747E
MLNILVVGNYNRKDYLDLFQASRGYCNFTFLEFTSTKEVQGDYYQNFGEAIFWGDYQNTFQLLEEVKPHKVIFFFIETYHHVALNVTCKLLNIKTYLLDHGIRDLNINVRLENHAKHIKQNPLQTFYNRGTQLVPRLKTRLFLLNTLKALPETESNFLKNYIKIRKKNSIWDTYKLIISPLRLTDAFICFSEKTYAVHQAIDHLPPNYPVHYIGIPFFDHLTFIKPRESIQKTILFIDQGLAIPRLFGWNKQNFKEFQDGLVLICAKYGHLLKIKLHPRQNPQDWETSGIVSVVTDEQLPQIIAETNIVLGFTSTLLLPLAALEHITLLTLENHPAGKLDVSKSFIDAGVAHPIYSLDELPWALENIEALHKKQLPNKRQFEEDWLYEFDGKAGERLRDILLSYEL